FGNARILWKSGLKCLHTIAQLLASFRKLISFPDLENGFGMNPFVLAGDTLPSSDPILQPPLAQQGVAQKNARLVAFFRARKITEKGVKLFDARLIIPGLLGAICFAKSRARRIAPRTEFSKIVIHLFSADGELFLERKTNSAPIESIRHKFMPWIPLLESFELRDCILIPFGLYKAKRLHEGRPRRVIR